MVRLGTARRLSLDGLEVLKALANRSDHEGGPRAYAEKHLGWASTVDDFANVLTSHRQNDS